MFISTNYRLRMLLKLLVQMLIHMDRHVFYDHIKKNNFILTPTFNHGFYFCVLEGMFH
jgi:hypothetical protein